MDRTLSLMLVFFGGGFGCLTRYLTTPDPSFPFTFANITACLVIGALYALTRYKVFTNPYAQSFISVGFLGGLSTFTPLATYAIASAEPTFLLSFVWFTVYLAGFFVLSLIGYIPAALYCKKVLKLQALPSLAAVVRTHQSKLQQDQQQQDCEQQAMQYAALLKELLELKDLFNTLKQQVAVLGELAKTNPQAAEEYQKAKAQLLQLQSVLQEQQALLANIDPMQGQAPAGLQPAPSFVESMQKPKATVQKSQDLDQASNEQDATSNVSEQAQEQSVNSQVAANGQDEALSEATNNTETLATTNQPAANASHNNKTQRRNKSKRKK